MATSENSRRLDFLPMPRSVVVEETLENYRKRMASRKDDPKSRGKTRPDNLAVAIQFAFLPTPEAKNHEGYQRAHGKIYPRLGTVISTYSPGDSPANPSPMQEKSEAIRTTVSSGLKCYESSGKRSPLGSLARMLLGSSTWLSTRCALTWKEKATKSSRLLYQLAPSVRRTAEIASGSSEGEPPLATPRASDWKGAAKTTEAKGRNPFTNSLMDAVENGLTPMLPTPTTNDQSGGANKVKIVDGKFIRDAGTIEHTANLNSVVRNGTETGARLRLQPAMTEWMMGYPPGWLSFPMEAGSPKRVSAAKA